MKKLTSRLPECYGRFFEPFAGGGALLFNEQPEQATISDLNSELINVYKIIRDSVSSLMSDLAKHDKEEAYF
ncbi:DNA adenine methylase [bacterium]|nr:DNA adenine methylase [bacterium]